jgi:hypothetical protein
MVALSCAVASLAVAPEAKTSVSRTGNMINNLLKNLMLLSIELKIVYMLTFLLDGCNEGKDAAPDEDRVGPLGSGLCPKASLLNISICWLNLDYDVLLRLRL